MSSSTDRPRVVGVRARRPAGTTEAGKEGRPLLPAAIFGLDATEASGGAAPILLLAPAVAPMLLQGVGDDEEEEGEEWDEEEDEEDEDWDDEDDEDEEDDEDWDEEDEEEEDEEEDEEE